MRTLLVFAAIAVGGAFGAVARALIADRVAALTTWPAWAGTLIANTIGCAGIGFAWVWLDARGHPDWIRGLLVTGALGAFTTFSTYGLDVMHLLHERRAVEACGYLFGSIAVGLVAVKSAMLLAERVL